MYTQTGTEMLTNAPSSISIGSSVFAGLTHDRDQHTDHATPSISIGRRHVDFVHAMWPEKQSRLQLHCEVRGKQTLR